MRMSGEKLLRGPYRAPGLCHGAGLRGGSIAAAVISLQTLILFAFKPLVHWLFGLSLSVMEMGFDGQAWAGAVL